MYIKWFDAEECLPAKDGAYLVYVDAGCGYITTCDYSGGEWWQDGVIFWARLPNMSDIQEGIDE